MPNQNLSSLIISLQKDFTGFKKDFTGFKKDFIGLKKDFTGFKKDLLELQDDFKGFRVEFDDFRNETNENFNEVYSKLDNHTAAIMSLENTVGFYGDMYKMNKDKIENHEKRINILESG